MLDWLRHQLNGSGSTENRAVELPQKPVAQDCVMALEEQVAQSLSRLRDDLRRVETRARTDADADLRSDKERLQRAMTFVSKSGIESAVLRVLEEVWHWSAWLQSDKDSIPLERASRLGISALDGRITKSTDSELKRLAFSFRERSFVFEFEQSTRSFEGRYSGRIRLFEDHGQVLGFRVNHDVDRDREYWQWRLDAVEVLAVGGWSSCILELEHAIRMARQGEQLSRESDRIRSLAKDLKDLP